MWREGKEVSLTDGEVEELTKSVKKKDRPKPKRSLTRTSSKRKKSTEDTESEEVSWSEKDSETEDTIVKTKQKYKDLCSENTSSSEVEVEYEPLRTIRMTTRSHALPEVLLLHQRVLEDDSSMEEDLDIPPPQPHSLPAAPPCPASSLSVTPSLLPTAPPAIRSDTPSILSNSMHILQTVFGDMTPASVDPSFTNRNTQSMSSSFPPDSSPNEYFSMRFRQTNRTFISPQNGFPLFMSPIQMFTGKSQPLHSIDLPQKGLPSGNALLHARFSGSL